MNNTPARGVGRITPRITRPDLVQEALDRGLPNPRVIYAEGGWWIHTITDKGITGLYLVTSQGLKRIRTGGDRTPRSQEGPRWTQGRLIP